MRNQSYSHLITLTAMVGVPTAFGAGLVDLGPAKSASWDSNIGNDKPPYVVDVSKDGTLAGGTDSSGHAFIWTPGNGKVIIGANVWLVGVDWFAGSVLAVGNYGSAYPFYWQGNADGTGGAWTSFPAMDGTSPWVATSLGVKADGSDWWAAGYKNITGNPYEYQLRYQNSTASATSIHFPSGGHARCFFYAASDQGTFAGVSQYGGSAPDGGSRNGVKWYEGINQPVNNYSVFCGPPEAGNGPEVSTSYTCIASAISGDGTVLGGVNKSDPYVWPALFWAHKVYVYRVPRLLISGSTYADWMGVRAINKNGSVMGGYFYPDPPTDAGPVQAFVYSMTGYTDNYPGPDLPDSATGPVIKLGDLLGAKGINTNGWTFREVTGLSDDGNTLVGYGVTNGVIHAWLAQLPPPVVHITRTSLDGFGNVLIDFTSSGLGDTTASFAVEQAGALIHGSTPFVDATPAATITGSAGSFQATVPQSGDMQFYQIRHL
jgi:hypothetical protein